MHGWMHGWRVTTAVQSICMPHEFVEIINNQPSPSNFKRTISSCAGVRNYQVTSQINTKSFLYLNIYMQYKWGFCFCFLFDFLLSFLYTDVASCRSFVV